MIDFNVHFLLHFYQIKIYQNQYNEIQLNSMNTLKFFFPKYINLVYSEFKIIRYIAKQYTVKRKSDFVLLLNFNKQIYC